MIIQNGYIEVKQIIGGGIDPQTDFPIPAQGVWGGRIACQITAKAYKHAALVGGEFHTQASYEILVDALDLDDLEPVTIRLSDLDGEVRGEYPIISVEYIKAARIYKVVV